MPKITLLVCGALIVGVAFSFYMVAKISLALVLLIGTFFLGCMLFPATRQYAFNWIGQCLNYIVSCSLLVLVVSVMMELFKKTLMVALGGNTAQNLVAMEAAIPLLILQTVCFLIILWNIPSIASALTGGAAMQTMARNVASMIGSASRYIGPMGGKAGSKSGGGNISPFRPKRLAS